MIPILLSVAPLAILAFSRLVSRLVTLRLVDAIWCLHQRHRVSAAFTPEIYPRSSYPRGSDFPNGQPHLAAMHGQSSTPTDLQIEQQPLTYTDAVDIIPAAQTHHKCDGLGQYLLCAMSTSSRSELLFSTFITLLLVFRLS